MSIHARLNPKRPCREVGGHERTGGGGIRKEGDKTVRSGGEKESRSAGLRVEERGEAWKREEYEWRTEKFRSRMLPPGTVHGAKAVRPPTRPSRHQARRGAFTFSASII